jgi:hypothetical protein
MRKITKTWYVPQNKNATIRSRTTQNGKLRTETHRRDDGTINAAISTDPRSNSSTMFIDFPYDDGAVRLTGHEARTLYRLLSQHFEFADKPL